MKKLRIGFVGTGGMGCGHLHCYKNIPDAQIVAACDIIPGKAEQKIKEIGFDDVHFYTDFKEMIDNEDIDAVDICTPNYFHSIIAVYALEHGKHVLCEKPDAVSVEEALKMKAAYEKSGKTLMVIRNNRWFEESKYIKKYIADGNCGEIYAGRCGWIRRRGIPGKGGWFTTKALSGGGPLIDLGVHMIDLSMYLMGNPKPVSVSGCTYNYFAENTAEADSEHAKFGVKNDEGTFDVEDLAMGFIRFENGACLQIEFSWASNIKEERKFLELRGSKAGFTIDAGEDLVIFTEDENGKLIDVVPEIGDNGDGHFRNITHFVDVALNGAKPDFVPDQGLNMIKILCAIYESAKTGHEVLL